jgi:hypothetical protein
MADVRAWEEIELHGRAWILCVGFGPAGSGRVVLCYEHGLWVLRTVKALGRSWIPVEPTVGHSPYIAEVELVKDDVDGAQRWALAELAGVARDLAQRYTGQTFQLMNELVRMNSSR